MNKSVDVVLVDSNLPNQGYAVFGVQLFPHLDRDVTMRTR